jgi:hypothetical protein
VARGPRSRGAVRARRSRRLLSEPLVRIATDVAGSTSTTYRIDVDDLVESGRNKDTFRIRTANGYDVGGLVTNGNIQIHG